MLIHVARDGSEIGQYNQQALNDLIDRGRLLPTDRFRMDGKAESMPLSVARSYFGHREKCRHCGGEMTEQRQLAISGPHQGQMKSICLKCGHTEYHNR
jgi:hypothetical protein